MKLEELFNPADLEREIADGYVSMRVHPKDPELRIYNYTDKSQIEHHWNDVTMHTRGLIVKDGEVVARGWRKFFNASEHPDLDWDDPCGWVLTDKIDGSLGILYFGPDGWAVSTRGSFDSEQAIEATKMLQSGRYDGLIRDASWYHLQDRTVLVEIIYPENRIVLDYGNSRKLVYLGTANERGISQRLGDYDRRLISSLSEAREFLNRENAEGWVAIRLDDGFMVKLKQEDYLLKHKARFGLNNKIVWRAGFEKDGIKQLYELIPDEYYAWLERTEEAMFLEAAEIIVAAVAADWDLQIGHPELESRAEKAAWIKENSPYPHLSFALLDNKAIGDKAWRMVEPKELEWATPL